MNHEANQFSSLPGWLTALAIHEAEKIYEMMPRMMGEKTQVIARLQDGIIELLSRELQQNAA